MVANAQSPRVLFYGHYDVQPPDPVEGWETPAFEPTVREGAVYARGSCDDKGQVSCFFEALRAWKVATGKLPCAVTVLIEGEEECGSVHFEPFLKAHARELAADIVVISDTSMWDAHTPAITYALRGLLYYDIKLYGPNRDLHSGVFGGALANPATMLTRVLGKLFDESQRVTIPGFYDDVMVVDEEQIEQWSKLDFDEKRFLGSVGVDRPFGENGYSTLERRWARPSCDVNGLYGGYMGEGAKTVIPSFAGAKVSFRLVANQDPVKIAAAFEQWLQEQETGGCRWQLTHHGGASPVAMPTDSPYIAAAKAAIKATAGINPVLVRDGATIPVVASFKKHLGVDSLMVGFGLEGDKIHSPNEHFALERFYLGCRTHAVMLREMGIMKRE
jgi:acetylornithine deacetylase/succinyl-diaminopimelate desuccinylase-like protein